jgi:hypothetical protein
MDNSWKETSWKVTIDGNLAFTVHKMVPWYIYEEEWWRENEKGYCISDSNLKDCTGMKSIFSRIVEIVKKRSPRFKDSKFNYYASKYVLNTGVSGQDPEDCDCDLPTEVQVYLDTNTHCLYGWCISEDPETRFEELSDYVFKTEAEAMSVASEYINSNFNPYVFNEYTIEQINSLGDSKEEEVTDTKTVDSSNSGVSSEDSEWLVGKVCFYDRTTHKLLRILAKNNVGHWVSSDTILGDPIPICDSEILGIAFSKVTADIFDYEYVVTKYYKKFEDMVFFVSASPFDSNGEGVTRIWKISMTDNNIGIVNALTCRSFSKEEDAMIEVDSYIDFLKKDKTIKDSSGLLDTKETITLEDRVVELEKDTAFLKQTVRTLKRIVMGSD